MSPASETGPVPRRPRRGPEPGPSAVDTSEVMDVHQAAAFLHVAVATVRTQLAAGRLPGKRVGKEWRLSRTALITWLSEPGEPRRRGGRAREEQ